jgi:hypothetical protein
MQMASRNDDAAIDGESTVRSDQRHPSGRRLEPAAGCQRWIDTQ